MHTHEPAGHDCPFCRLQRGVHDARNRPEDVVAATGLAFARISPHLRLRQDRAMDFQQMQQRARTVRSRYAEVEAATYGRSWTTEEIMLGFLGDVGDLAKLVQGKAGVRPRDDLDEALAHELADCLWSILTLADAYDVDLAGAFASTMDELDEVLAGD